MKMSVSLTTSLQKTLYQEIPLTQKMNLQVRDYDGNQLRLYYPLEKNVRHAFAGSIFSLATLAGWGLIYLKLQELDIPANTVMQAGAIHYLSPIVEDFEAICKIEDEEKFDQFIHMLQRKRLARLKLHPMIKSENVIKAKIDGSFVAKT
jgi:thioesterase domain-containing protein